MILTQTESARRDTLITRASDDALDELSAYYGLIRPSSYPYSAWRAFLETVIFQPRGTMSSLFNALSAILKPWTDQTSRTVDISATGEIVDASIDSTAYAHRWIRIGEDRYQWVDSVDVATNTAQLNVNACAYWSAWDTAENGVEVAWLPFHFVEFDGVIKIYIDLDLMSVPPTYLQPAGAARPAGQPYGGQLLNLLDLDPATLDYGNQTEGPYPLYLRGDAASGILGDIFRYLIAGGVRVEIIGLSFGASIGYSAISQI
jgi:hypothetical protein